MNINFLACYYSFTYFIYVILCFCYSLLTMLKLKLTTKLFNPICIVYKSFRISRPTNINKLINIEHLAYYCYDLYFIFILY